VVLELFDELEGVVEAVKLLDVTAGGGSEDELVSSRHGLSRGCFKGIMGQA